MNNIIKVFTDLNAWQESHKLVILVYMLTKKFPKEEQFVLTSQIRRAVVSVTSNIAEGFGRFTFKEKARFYYQASGSLSEVENQLLIAKDVSFISQQDFEIIQSQLICAHKLLHGLITKTKNLAGINNSTQSIHVNLRSQVSSL